MSVYFLIYCLLVISICNKKNKKLFTIISLCLMIFFASVRSVGSDWLLYKTIYSRQSFSDRFDIGYKLLMKACYCIFHNNYFFVTLFISICTILIVYSVIKKESKALEISLFLFVTLGFYTKSFNIMKQMLAVAVTFYGARFITERKLCKYVITIFIASLFHKTALIMIPFYWLSDLKISKGTSIITFFSIILSLLLFNKIFNFVTLNIDQYQVYNTYTLGIESGIGTVLNILFFGILVLFLLFNYEKMLKVDENNKYFINMCSFSLPILILSLKNTLFFRIALYPLIYIILPLVNIDKVFSDSSRRFFNLCFYVLVSFFYFLTVYGFGGVYPYKWIL